MKQVIVFSLVICFVILPSILYLTTRVPVNSDELNKFDGVNLSSKFRVSTEKSRGPVIMPALNNSTLKAELGRSTWKLLHTITARFPEKPTENEKDALRNYVYLFSRLYPCGECATEFQKILEKYPPQVSSREAASQWMCAIHNIVNKRLKKEQFDCAQIADKYKCGCDDDETNTTTSLSL
ncbi:4141_t:CDS:2 [Ambispora gerdemannii]|uniref:Sulfhydryl oxidase n=1 Tax=Ambispora gerdemannii TaxID=144530 RepID=A0A9N8ZHH0_9GLOM|nr:4141_t:CDS:2 [Ambispora gerdemannii]